MHISSYNRRNCLSALTLSKKTMGSSPIDLGPTSSVMRYYHTVGTWEDFDVELTTERFFFFRAIRGIRAAISRCLPPKVRVL